MFKSIIQKQLTQLIKAELQNIDIRAVTYDSRSESMEYARIYFNHCGSVIRYPFIEIIDDCLISLGGGSMTYAFQGDDYDA